MILIVIFFFKSTQVNIRINNLQNKRGEVEFKGKNLRKRLLCLLMGREAWSVGHGAWGIEHGAWSMGHGAWGVGRGAWGMEHGAWGRGRGLPHAPRPMPHAFLKKKRLAISCQPLLKKVFVFVPLMAHPT